MGDLNDFKVSLIRSPEEFSSFIEKCKSSGDTCFGVDTETNGTDFTTGSLAGLSLSSHVLQESVYVPLNHKSYNIDFSQIKDSLQSLIIDYKIIFHGSTFDMCFLNKEGLKFYDTGCTYILANMLQARNGGLKDLVLEYELINFRDVISYPNLIKNIFNLGNTLMKKIQKKDDLVLIKKYSFGQIDLVEHPEAIQYACNDSIWTEALYPLMIANLKALTNGQDLSTDNLFT